MIRGLIVLEDITISFDIDDANICKAILTDTQNNITEHIECEGHKFMKALAINVHYDGMPDYKKDYPDAESIQGVLRWIP